jgi:hypothetical protein
MASKAVCKAGLCQTPASNLVKAKLKPSLVLSLFDFLKINSLAS